LKAYGEFPESVRISDTVTFVEGDMDDEIEFDDYSSSDNEAEVDAI
jgi:translation initiation factor 1A